MLFPPAHAVLNSPFMSLDEKRVPVSARSVKSKFPSATMLPYTRREFAKLSLAALPGAGLLSAMNRLGAAETPGKPNSKVAGVQLGLNVPYSFANLQMSGDDILKNCLQLGLSAVELRTQPVESFLGAPAKPTNSKKKGTAGNSTADADQLAQWRKSVSMDKAKEFRHKYEAAGVLI